MAGRPCALAALLLAGVALEGCAGVHTPPVTALPAVEVKARGETQPVGTANQDAADDPAIWRNAADPQRSILVGTDKKAGLYTYALDGSVKSFQPAGLFNNVALIETEHGILVAASDRSDPLQAKVAFFTLDPANGALTLLGHVASGAGEAYGLCMIAKPGEAGRSRAHVYAAIKDGTVREIALSYAPGEVSGQIMRQWKIATQIEGCVIDPVSDTLFVGEEAVGIWRIALGDSVPKPVLFAGVDRQRLVADVEGLALAMRTDGSRVLIASSQGDNAYAAYDAVTAAYIGRFRITDGAIDGTSETDGIEVMTGDFGADYPDGLFVAQDGDNGGGTQNFKLVPWAEIEAALGL